MAFNVKQELDVDFIVKEEDLSSESNIDLSIVKDEFPSEGNICSICSSSVSDGLTQIDSTTRNRFAELFQVQVEENGFSCSNCLLWLDDASIKKEHDLPPCLEGNIEVKRERSVSEEPGSCESDDDWPLIGLSCDEHDAKKVPCNAPGCDKTFTERRFMHLHYTRVHKTNVSWFCNGCNQMTTGVQSQHYKIFHKNLSKTERQRLLTDCNVCGEKQPSKGKLYDHKKQKHPELFGKSVEEAFAPIFEEGKGWKCCGRLFRNKNTLHAHKSMEHRSAIEEKPHLCQMCHELCQNKAELMDHQKKIHKGLTKEEKMELKLKCHTCGRLFKSLELSRFHKRRYHPELFTPTTEKKFEPKLLTVEKKPPKPVQTSKRTEKQEKPHLCQMCDALCQNKKELMGHQKIVHNNLTKEQKMELKLKCHTCGRLFKSLELSRFHKRRYHPELFAPTTEKKFEPKVEAKGWMCCDRLYYTKTALGYHKTMKHRTSVGQKVCLCLFCAELFRSKRELMDHQRAAHKGLTKEEKLELKMKCHKCGIQFMSVDASKYHRRRYHPELFGGKQKVVVEQEQKDLVKEEPESDEDGYSKVMEYLEGWDPDVGKVEEETGLSEVKVEAEDF